MDVNRGSDKKLIAPIGTVVDLFREFSTSNATYIVGRKSAYGGVS